MSMPLDPTSSPPPSPARSFWRSWRREIIRGGVLFGLVVCVGLVVSQVHVGMPVTLEQLRALKDFDIDPSGNLFGAGREIGDQWEWRGVVKPSQQVWIRNTNGPVDVVSGNTDQLEVIAEKSWRHSTPDIVQMVAVPSQQGVTICAVWKARESRCGDRGDYEQHNIRRNDVAVRFTVTLPRGVRLDVSTVNGAMAIAGATAGVQASTVNGRIQLHGAAGPTKAETVNGSVEARLDAMTGGDVEIETVNGSVTAFVPAKLNALLEAETVNGRVQTELPVQMTGKISPRHVRGTIGIGGPSLKLTTVNGSITIKELGATPAPDEPPPPSAPRAPRATGRVTRVTPPPPR
jgi:putative adhesin